MYVNLRIRRTFWQAAAVAALIVGCNTAKQPMSSDDEETSSEDMPTQEGVTSSGGGPSSNSGGDNTSSTGSSSLHGSGGGATTSSGGPSSSATSSGAGGGGQVNTDCCIPSMVGGCADTQLEACVCGQDSYCCDNEWDAICVTIAQNNCGACAGAPCIDIGSEPSNSEANAASLASQPISDCNGTGGIVNGTINGSSDVDWYTYAASDELGCVVDPTRTLTSISGGVRLCKYAECYMGATNVTCPIGTTQETSPDGRSGCCANFGFQFDDLDCADTFSDDAFIYIRVDQPAAQANTCNHYAIDFHY
jgi:hypothetical protein